MAIFAVQGDLAISADGVGFIKTARGTRVAQSLQNKVDLLTGTYEYAPLEGAKWVEILHTKHGEQLIGQELVRLALQDPEIVRAEVISTDYDRIKRAGTAKVRCWFAGSSEDVSVNL